jgi:hypothetical protein
MRVLRSLNLGILLALLSFNVAADVDSKDKQSRPQVMNNQHLDKLIKRLDENVKGQPGFWTFTIDGKLLRVITDEKANRMRIIAPITKSDELEKQQLYRLMQANFDSTLDARYAIAKGVVWSSYLHPLSSLTEKEFIIATGQVANLVATYGGSFSSGLLIFQGGDSKDLQRRNLIDKLLEKGLEV